MSIPTQVDVTTLECLIDRVGLQETLNMVAAICAAKGAHILASYGDRHLAGAWNHSGMVISETADDSHIGSISL